MRGEVFSEYELFRVETRRRGEARRRLRHERPKLRGPRVARDRGLPRDVADLHRLAQRREEYAALISHDLRGPLTSIVFSAQALKRSLERAQAPEDVRTIGRIMANADRMTSMIGELLEAASLEGRSCRPRFVRCNLAEVVAGVVERMDDALRRRIRVDAPERSYPVSGDPERLERAIANLVANAIKYSPGETEVLVALAKGDGELSVAVVDRGIGIAKANLPKLFERYSRHPNGKPVGGLGLGLYIAGLITEAHRPDGSRWRAN